MDSEERTLETPRMLNLKNYRKMKNQMMAILRSVTSLSAVHDSMRGKLSFAIEGSEKEFDQAIENIITWDRLGYTFRIKKGLSVTFYLA